MRGLTFVEKGRAAFLEEPDPVCGPDQVLLRTLYSGLSNGTERSFLMSLHYGWDLPYPKRIGYQLVSEVVACGDAITRFRPGDVVFTGTFPGHVEFHTARESDLIVKLPPEMDLEEAALLGVASVSWFDAARGRIAPGDRVLVVGDGLIGQFAAQAARCRGARVVMAGHHDDRLEIASALGVDRAVNTRGTGGREPLRDEAPFSVVMETTGAEVLDRIIGSPEHKESGMMERHGRVVLIGGRREVRYSYLQAGSRKLDILHTGHFRQEDLEAVVERVRNGDLRIRPLIRDVVPVEEAPGIYDILAREPRRLLGTVFDWR